MKWLSLSRIPLFATPWSIADQVSLSLEFSRQEYWSRLPCPSPVDLLDPGIELGFPALQANSLPMSHQGSLSAQAMAIILSLFLFMQLFLFQLLDFKFLGERHYILFPTCAGSWHVINDKSFAAIIHFLKIHLFTWLCQALVAPQGILSSCAPCFQRTQAQ